jgi:endonuclease/exonuclease/phosphatase family metal-dependent hydrolase
MMNRSSSLSVRVRRGVMNVLLPLVGATTAAAGVPDTQPTAWAAAVAQAAQRQPAPGTLRVLTLNLAHGRKDALNQILLSRDAIERNLAEASAVLAQAGADVVALQEADGPSRWSGGFDHVEFLASRAGYRWHSRGTHARSWLFDYGTALLSRVPFTANVVHAFQPTPPSLTKGLTLGQVAWQSTANADPVLIDVVSVHLDFSRPGVRARQTAEMIELLAAREHPVIVLGDLNSDWSGSASVVTELAQRCRLQAYQPLADNMGTYRASGRRLDWVLISGELEFTGHDVLPQVVSDHYAVVADIRLRDRARQAAAGRAGCAG